MIQAEVRQKVSGSFFILIISCYCSRDEATALFFQGMVPRVLFGETEGYIFTIVVGVLLTCSKLNRLLACTLETTTAAEIFD